MTTLEGQAKFSYSKVARRIFGLFIISALLPVIVLSLISFRQVTQQLDSDSRQDLHQAAKNEGMAIYGRLQLLDSEMVQAAAGLSEGRRELDARSTNLRAQGLLDGLAVVGAGGVQPVFGHVDPPLALSLAQEQHLYSGRSLLLTSGCEGTHVCLQLLRYVDVQHPARGLLIGKINVANLLIADTLAEATRLCVIAGDQTVFCPGEDAGSNRSEWEGKSWGTFEWQGRQQAYVGAYWKLFLKPTFGAPQWNFVVSKSRTDILAQARQFGRTFLIVILLSLLVVVLLTLVQIRRSMVPLEKLQWGIQQTAQRRFDTRVEINSGDEFQQLAEGFNQMTRDLGKQFRALEAVREVDRAILSSLRSEEIIRTVLEHIRAFLPYEAVSMTLLGKGERGAATTYATTGLIRGEEVVATVNLSSAELEELGQPPTALLLNSDGADRGYLAHLRGQGMKWFLAVPIRQDQGLLGVLVLGNSTPPVESPDDRIYAMQLADRLAVALSNARLVEELADLNLGTFTALARAIDAKSEWTSGHSERVTNLAVEIGEELGLPERETRILHRGGLLHDIGKIGTPAGILDKPGKLTDEEFRIMRQHVTTGARILEPIPGFAELIPIVLQHHERFDGSGYPDGLAGEQISLYARIFAVADVYDALVSDRPYRSGWPKERVFDFIQEQSGTQFDPAVVRAFTALMKRRTTAEDAGSAPGAKETNQDAALRRAQCAS